MQPEVAIHAVRQFIRFGEIYATPIYELASHFITPSVKGYAFASSLGEGAVYGGFDMN